MTINQDIDATASEDFYKSFRRNGYAVIDDILSVSHIKKLHTEFNTTYQNYIDAQDYAENSGYLKVGSKRYMCNVALTGSFGDSLIYANPHVLPKIRTLLGDDAIIESYGAIISLPGSKTQHRHRDSHILFDERLDLFLPPHALTLVIPLIEMNAQHGSTAFWPGTHLPTASSGEDSEPIVPTVAVGSCALWDYRIKHGGTPNISSTPRPILYISYSKSWFRDTKNYRNKHQRRLSFKPDFPDSLTDEHKTLFSHVILPDATLI